MNSHEIHTHHLSIKRFCHRDFHIVHQYLFALGRRLGTPLLVSSTQVKHQIMSSCVEFEPSECLKNQTVSIDLCLGN